MQLDYSRSGNTVFCSFLPSLLMEKLQYKLVPHAAYRKVTALWQNVEVQLTDSPDEYQRQNACTIAESLKSVEE